MIELSTLAAPVLSALLGAIATGISIYVAMSNRLSILETKMDNLAEDVRKHNGVIARTYKLESDMGTAFHRIDDIRNEIHR